MSSISKRKNSKGRAVYLARWREHPGAPERSRQFGRKIDAEHFLVGIDGSKLEGSYVDPAAGRITFGEYAEGWLDRKRSTVKPSTSSTFASHLSGHILKEFGVVPLRSITREQVKAWAGRLQPGLAPTTARAVAFTLAAVLREAVDDGRIVKNPAERIKVGAKTERRVDPMHIAHVAGKVPALAEAVPARWRAAVLLMASTGLRLGECMGLTVDRVDFLRRTIRVDRQLVGGVEVFGTPKTRAGVRTIPVPADVVELLAGHLAEYGSGDNGLIFSTVAGRPVTRGRWSHKYRQACAEVEVVGRTRTHDLRHVCASSLIAEGLSVAAVAAVLGHAGPAETLEVYTHLWPSDEERTRDAMESITSAWLSKAT